MAFNAQAFKTRTISAIIFAAVMLLGLLWNKWSFFILFSIIHFGCWLEYQKIIGRIDPGYHDINPFHKYGIIVLGWGFMMFLSDNMVSVPGVSLSEVGWGLMLLLVITLPVVEILSKYPFRLKNFFFSMLGLLYISLPLALMVNLRTEAIVNPGGLFDFDLGWIVPVILISSIWINDTMAYIVGSFIGKTPFSSISPKKTWEGTIGGAVLAVATVSLVGHFVFGIPDIASLIAISLIAAVMGTLGDLLESKLKRMAHLKDSGNIMPGHGGMLDRFDSLLIAIPFVWLYFQLIM